MNNKTRITVAYGDGIGPEIMTATMEILRAAEAPLEYDVIEIGEKVYLQGCPSGIADSSWDTVRKNKIILKAPITTPQGGGIKSLNVTLRKTLGLYSNVRPCRSFSPFVKTFHPNMDVVIVRENEECLYGGIEHQQTPEVVQTLRIISEPGCRRIVRYAFEYAKQNNRKLVSCFTKDNIMKQSDGLFHRCFNEIAKEYPDIKNDHYIIDIGSARLANNPERFDVIVTSNLYGDIISDIAAEITGSVGLAGSSNIGAECAMFEAIHGSAPDIAGKGIANPSGLLMGAVMMLVHIGEGETASKIHNAWLRTIEEGIHTADVYREGVSKRKVSTTEFTAAVIKNLGNLPEQFTPVTYVAQAAMNLNQDDLYIINTDRQLVGSDVFVYMATSRDAKTLADKITPICGDKFTLEMISNRGTVVWPTSFPETFCTDHWRARIMGNGSINSTDVIELLGRIDAAGIDIIKIENLYKMNGVDVYSKDQGA